MSNLAYEYGLKLASPAWFNARNIGTAVGALGGGYAGYKTTDPEASLGKHLLHATGGAVAGGALGRVAGRGVEMGMDRWRQMKGAPVGAGTAVVSPGAVGTASAASVSPAYKNPGDALEALGFVGSSQRAFHGAWEHPSVPKTYEGLQSATQFIHGHKDVTNPEIREILEATTKRLPEAHWKHQVSKDLLSGKMTVPTRAVSSAPTPAAHTPAAPGSVLPGFYQ